MRRHATSTTAAAHCNTDADTHDTHMLDASRHLGAQSTPSADATPLPYLEAGRWLEGNPEADDAQQLERLLLGLRQGWSYSLAYECTQGMAARPLGLALQAIKDYLEREPCHRQNR